MTETSAHSALYRKHILGVDQFDPELLAEIFPLSVSMLERVDRHDPTLRDILAGYLLIVFFYEASTRTSCSHEAAMKRLGGEVIVRENIQFSSVSKGETLEDTIRTFAQYGDIIALRHYDVGSVERASKVCDVPIINAGDGTGEHPTQALLDVFTIRSEMKNIESLKVVFVGDLKHGRTVHSLSRLIASRYGTRIGCYAPESLRMSNELRAELGRQTIVEEYETFEQAIAEADVLYVTRIQQERMPQVEYDRVKGMYILTPELMQHAKERMIVMHPFPRKGEIDSRVDLDPRAAYFRQAKNGLAVRMALLKLVLAG